MVLREELLVIAVLGRGDISGCRRLRQWGRRKNNVENAKETGF
jgi:hypothetical protein